MSPSRRQITVLAGTVAALLAGLFAALAFTSSTETVSDVVSVSRTSKTLESVGWQPVPGVSGYALLKNGVVVATAGPKATSTRFSASGNSYKLEVRPLFATTTSTATATVPTTTTVATTTAPTTTIATTTTTPPAQGTANLFVALSGSDSGCARSASPLSFSSAGGHVCASFDRACHLASGGDTVIVEDGRYPGQRLDDCTGISSPVTFRTEPGHECGYSARTPVSQLPAQNADASCPVTLSGDLELQAAYRGDPKLSPLKNLTFVGMHVHQFETTYAHAISFERMEANLFYINSSDGITISNGSFGNVFDGACATVSGRGAGTPDSSNVTIRGSIFHDSMRLTSAQDHPDGLFIQGLNGGVIDGNVFYRDAVLPLYLNSVAGGTIANIQITNNVIHDVVDMTDTGSSTRSVPRSSLLQQTLSLGDDDLSNVTVAFNSVAGVIRRQDNSAGGSGTGLTRGLRIYGNVAYGVLWQNGWGCGNNTVYDYNVWFGSEPLACGPHDAKAANPFTSNDLWSAQNEVTPGNFALLAGSRSVGFVPSSWCASVGVCPSADVTGAVRPAGAHPAALDAGAYENR